jgi:hypothetical protein
MYANDVPIGPAVNCVVACNGGSAVFIGNKMRE